MENKENNLNNVVEQGESKKNSLNNADEQDVTGEQGEVGMEMTLEQVKAEVLKLVDEGENYRDIAKIKWNVKGAKKHFSITWISNLVKKRNNPQSSLLKLSDEELTKRAFKLFDAGNGPIAVVEQLDASPDEAKTLYNEYVELKALDLSKPSIPLQFKQFKERLDRLDNGWYIIQSLVEAVNKEIPEILLPKREQIKGIDLCFLFLEAKEVCQHVNESNNRLVSHRS
ncbi:MAG: hypothetical protein ABSB40_02040 [Nitrososphaeria archaeon]|jgi:hypothetical protein